MKEFPTLRAPSDQTNRAELTLEKIRRSVMQNMTRTLPVSR